MAKPAALYALLVVTIVLSSEVVTMVMADCGVKCEVRCSDTQYKKACLTMCNHCCNKCGDDCVPPGTYGNKEKCPCYNNMKTQEGKPKCP